MQRPQGGKRVGGDRRREQEGRSKRQPGWGADQARPWGSKERGLHPQDYGQPWGNSEQGRDKGTIPPAAPCTMQGPLSAYMKVELKLKWLRILMRTTLPVCRTLFLLEVQILASPLPASVTWASISSPVK